MNNVALKYEFSTGRNGQRLLIIKLVEYTNQGTNSVAEVGIPMPELIEELKKELVNDGAQGKDQKRH